ncbi:Fuc2NAc and GlcNAc transferase [Devosia subaequoris]|uniref:Fuc2NAc and GlcNAc transferase n=1 Tax=Devosia subaequoris TaxID=395930 RepID=A0A7W6IKL9_9HYPH|nr:Fuc2NAc and GlcNAc transferase [Devosia subaequoris]MCP1211399.1 glycosyltransferase family 4 protein [Devosia subaequoris]
MLSELLVIFLGFAAVLASYVLTIQVERKASRLGLVKAANERSSHIVPTARGGGLGLAIVGVIGCLTFASVGSPILALVGVLGAVIAAIGFVDDLLEVSVATRLAVQSAVVIALVAGVELFLAERSLSLTIARLCVLGAVVLAGIWWVNAFNFMDGIDGIAASQAVLVLAGGMAIWLCTDRNAADYPMFGAIGIIVAATCGFLLRNWPPAKIFMGDIGSTFLGLMILAVALITVKLGALSWVAWLILLSVFAADSMITLVRRTLRGERPWRAHRRHAYQQLARRWGHRNVTVLYSALTCIWALPLAAASSIVTPTVSLWLPLVAYVPLGVLFLWAGAGARDEFQGQAAGAITVPADHVE